MGGDCDLFLANRRPRAVASDLVSANHSAVQSPVGNSRRVPEPCASGVETGTVSRERNKRAEAFPSAFVGLSVIV